ncbi:DUF4956 domain-containing protein [Aerococcaceae bacterium DSM 111020]|nr:DUF4956 domain-containing protein [Aerococcaceae bacterium DSM 111020]
MLEFLEFPKELITESEILPNLSNAEVISSIVFSLILSVIMYLTFKKVHNKLAYDPNFNIMLVMLAVISTIIMLLIRGNVALSLGMLGSLSLVRFRTNIKDNRDIGFVFWAMFIGLVSASHEYFLGVLGSLILALLLIIADNRASSSQNMLLVIRGRYADIEAVDQTLYNHASSYNLKAQNLLDDSFELVYYFRAKPANQDKITTTIKGFEGVDTVNILAPSAEMS